MRSLARIFVPVVCSVSAGCTHSSATTTVGASSGAVDQLASSVVSRRGVPGIAVAVLRGGEVIHKVTLGSADLRARRPVTAATPFQLASTTKTFASAGILLLVADGRVRLEDSIGEYLDGLPSKWQAVTLRQLLSHTSGLPDISTSTGSIELVSSDWDGALSIIRDRPLQFEPGSGWAYTQTNYALLLRLIERVSGATFERFLQRRLFHPLGMRNTFFPDRERKCAVNYKRDQYGRTVERPELSFPHYAHAAGGLCSSLDDLIAWSRALKSGKILPQALVREAWTPVKLANGSTAQAGGSRSYGLGWAVEPTIDDRWVGHSGGNATAFREYLDDGLTVIVLHNGMSDPDAIVSRVANSVLQKPGGGAQAALWDAAGENDLVSAKAALEGGADVNALDTRSSGSGRYALNWAAINNYGDMITLLLESGASINAQNRTGFTALHHAAESGSAAAAQVLLTAGADTSLRNARGETPSDIARRAGHAVIAQLIDLRTRRAP